MFDAKLALISKVFKKEMLLFSKVSIFFQKCQIFLHFPTYMDFKLLKWRSTAVLEG